jgi:N-acetylmuramoyl-L-alanine amidase
MRRLCFEARRLAGCGAALLVLLLGEGCRGASVAPPPAEPSAPHVPHVPRVPPPARTDDAILVAGERVPIGTRVVLWTEAPFYDAYRLQPRFADSGPEGLRYRPGRDGLSEDPAPEALRSRVDQFVLHYDACGTSERCFRVLHDVRKLSVHFLLDTDGTLYQTLDLREQAWHATKANPRSVGVEIANIGAFPPGAAQALWDFYGVAPGAARASPDVGFVEGVVQGQRLVQGELTPAQVAALVKLAAGLCRTFPRLRADAPRDAAGRVRDGVLSEAEYAAFGGILGHFHVQENKLDPGPAFPWEDFLAAVRRELASP